MPTPLSDHLAPARLWAAARFPYLASALFALDPVECPGIGDIAVGETWTLYLDPATVAGWTEAQLGSLLVHHLGHLLREHAARARSLGVTKTTSDRWVRAADAEINDDLVDAGLDQPGHLSLPADFGAEPGRFAEEYFGWQHTRPEPDGGSTTTSSCGSGADGLTRPWDRPGDGPVPPGSARLLRWQTANEVVAYSRGRGQLPGGWLRWAKDLLYPQVDWRQVLGAEVRRGLARRAGMMDYSYATPSRRTSVAGPVVLPSLRQAVPEVAVVCDTSASITDNGLAMILAEVEGVVHGAGVLWPKVTVLTCDATVQGVQRVTNPQQIRLVGGGGTDMAAGLAAAADLRPRPTVVVVLTDGWTPWPSEFRRGVHVVVGLLDRDAPLPPPWARWVRIGNQRLGA